MELFHENHSVERDLPFLPSERQSTVEGMEDQLNGTCAPACPWSAKCADGWGLATYPLAMVYAPCQGFHSLYDEETALSRGTLFSELDLPLEVVVGEGRSTTCGGCARAFGKCRL